MSSVIWQAGVLGVVQGLLILLAFVIIFDPYFRASSGVTAPNELPLLRGLHNLFEGSITAEVYRSTLVPGFLALFGVLIPDTIEAGVLASGFERLPITFAHAEAAGRLPPHHADPFDRMLIAQARLEGLTLVTHDRQFEPYGLQIAWV